MSSSSWSLTRSPVRQGRASFCEICQHTSSRSLFAGRWPVSALPPARRRARLNTCRSRPVSARCTRCRCYNCVCSCVTLPSQVHRRQTPSTSTSCSARSSHVSSVKTRHISWSSLSGYASEQGVCVQKVAGASPDRWGHGATAGQRGPPWSRGQCLCSCVTLPITRPAACGRSRRSSSSSGSSSRRVGLEEARLVNLAKTVTLILFNLFFYSSRCGRLPL